MPEKSLLRGRLRQVVKGAYWTVTPWWVRRRVQSLRAGFAVRAVEAKVASWVQQEQARLALRRRGAEVPAVPAFDLLDEAPLAGTTAGPGQSIFCWARVHPSDVLDEWSAARFLVDLWRHRADVRARFPAAILERGVPSFEAWLRAEGAAELGLTGAAVALLTDVLHAGFADKARQAFLASDKLVSVLPHGLTPVGLRELLRWFSTHGMSDAGLRPEEVAWLALEASQDPRRELMLAYTFAPAWQQVHPDGMTVFGRDAFAAWFAAEYGATGAWVDPSGWPEWEAPATQIRTSYWARDGWRAAHPMALSDETAARAFLAWLASPAAGLSQPLRAWCGELDARTVGAEIARSGANVIGHFCYPSGLRVSVESMVEAMSLAGVTTSLRDVRTDVKDDPHHVDFGGMECNDITIIHTQPEPYFDTAYQRAHLFARAPRPYRVAYWYWEFDSIPESWVAHARKVDEVWAATEFVAKGLRARLSVPVRTLFPGVKLAAYEQRGLGYFGLTEEPYTFLFTFHMMSVMERKNPLGLIRAFKMAFRAGEPVRLILKTSFGNRHPAQLQELRDAAEGANIVVIDQVLDPGDVLSLMDACDAYVSLHRSEGLGLTMAEAMLMGKPVIATNFSGNVDFMDDSNSLLVPYELVKLGWPIPPYDAHLEWAEPSVEHAAQHMRRVFDNQSWARELGERGRRSAEANLSLHAAGDRIARRLEEIRALRRPQL